MTTIVYRDGILAADTMLVDRDTNVGTTKKIVRSFDGYLGGCAGCLGDAFTFMQWFDRPSTPSRPRPKYRTAMPPEFKDESSEGILVSPDGTIEWIGYGKKRVPIIADYYAIGSGFQIAMGALHAGAGAIDAVAAAIELDLYSGGETQFLLLGNRNKEVAKEAKNAKKKARMENYAYDDLEDWED